MSPQEEAAVAEAAAARAPAHLRAQIGRGIAEIATPALVLHVERLDRNIETMARWAAGHEVELRPHAKIHKCAQIARRQLDAGAVGLTVATVFEALAMRGAGPAEILIANEIVDPEKLRLVAEIATEGSVLVAVDDLEGVRALGAAAAGAGCLVGVLIEVDVGMTRGGARSVDETRALAATVVETSGVELRGVMGYEGHIVTEPNRETRAAGGRRAMDLLAEHVAALRDDGYAVDVVSAGGTNTYDSTGSLEIVTELQAGTYALMDTSYAPLAPAFAPALGVVGTVVSRQDDRVVLDCGSKCLASTPMAAPQPVGPGLSVDQIDEEHALLSCEEGAVPSLGERVELWTSYCGGTTNLHDGYLLVREEEVIGAWPILATGPGRA